MADQLPIPDGTLKEVFALLEGHKFPTHPGGTASLVDENDPDGSVQLCDKDGNPHMLMSRGDYEAIRAYKKALEPLHMSVGCRIRDSADLGPVDYVIGNMPPMAMVDTPITLEVLKARGQKPPPGTPRFITPPPSGKVQS